MPRTNINIAKGSKAVRKDPACGTCRKKCRKCDRTRPICNRCKSKGLHCEGYPPRFQFLDSIPSSDGARVSNAETKDSAVVLPTLEDGRTQDTPLPPAETSAPRDQQSRSMTRLPSQPSHSTADVSTASSQGTSVGQPSPTVISRYPVDEELLTAQCQKLLLYFDKELSQHLAIMVEETENPFCVHVLPLAYQHSGVLHATLGLASCHLSLSPSRADRADTATALQHRVAALNALSSLLTKEEMHGLTTAEEEAVLAIILILVLHDICEMGISSHAVHLTGVSFLCGRVAAASNFSQRSDASMFFLSALAWLDVLRGFSGAEKLTYSQEVRLRVLESGSRHSSLQTLVGCPPIMFYRIGEIIAAAKRHLLGFMPLVEFEQILADGETFFREINLDKLDYPTGHPEWKPLAEAYRHACLLRVMRWPDTFGVPCEDERIKASVSAILDVCSSVPMRSPFYKRFLFPLFMAAADTSVAHQMHYASLCIQEIKDSTGFRHAAMTEVLNKVWDVRRSNSYERPNIPWMEFTCSETLKSQHAYLFF
ncbi:hypothetical protein CSOJ01_05439 [Colletotrichum sojae]|uniref:Zn(2)-C6 fungal-type domain-containing protein n=1 Tax=Colletotrichum sojae TaxID=2175907 RepID=A0A8H6MXH4_9PEZI|nr:hypothetical protein CSOJ01_05439 [Colletotrichum sojae]